MCIRRHTNRIGRWPVIKSVVPISFRPRNGNGNHQQIITVPEIEVRELEVAR